MDISETLAPKSDQLDAVELVAPRTFEIERVSKGSAEQPIQVHLLGFPRVWRPGVTMRRLLARLWGSDSEPWTGRRVTLYNDEKVRFGTDVTGGTRIAAMSDIGDKPKSVTLPVSRGKVGTFTVQPLPELSKRDALAAEWKTADPERRAAIEAEVASLGGDR